MLNTNLPGVVVGISEIHSETVVLAEVWTQKVASTIYANAAWVAGRTCGGKRFGRRRDSHWQSVDILLAERPAISAITCVYCSQTIELLT